jgi:hypothetical protein
VKNGGKVVFKNCHLEDLRHALRVEKGSSIDIQDNEFNNNYIGLYLRMETFGSANILAANNNKFRTTTAVKTPYPGMTEVVETRGFAGIYAHQSLITNFFGRNYFDKLANGAYLYASNFNLLDFQMTDIKSVGGGTGSYSFAGYGFFGRGQWGNFGSVGASWTNPSIENCVTGVNMKRMAGQVIRTSISNADEGIRWLDSRQNDIRIRNNTLSVRKRGIVSNQNEPLFRSGSLESDIKDNTISITEAGTGLNPVLGIESLEGAAVNANHYGWEMTNNNISMKHGGRGIYYLNGRTGYLRANSVNNLDQTNAYDGILLEGATGSTINANTIGQLATGGFGISHAIRSSSGTGNTLRCNCVDNTSVGMQFYDLGDHEDMVGGNRFNSHSVGLRLGDLNVGSAYIGTQYHTGNRWDEPGIGGENYGGTTNVVDASKFTVNSQENAAFLPVVDPADWFFDDKSNSSNISCSSACAFPNPQPPAAGDTEQPVPSDLDVLIAGGQFPVDANSTEMTWKANHRLYRKMLRHPALQNWNSSFAAFKAAQQNLSTGQLAYVSEQRAGLWRLTPTQEGALVGSLNTLRQKHSDLAALDQQQQAGQPIDQLAYATLLAQHESAQQAHETALQDIESLRQQAAQVLLSYNSNIATASTPAQNHKSVNAILLQYVTSGQYSSADITALDAIASQCPLTGGDAVYEARSVVAEATGAYYDDPTVCATGGRPALEREKLVALDKVPLQFYPNPTTGMLMWSGTELSKLRLINAQGRLVLEANISEGQIDLGGLPDGIYLVHPFDAQGKALELQKISLLKQ